MAFASKSPWVLHYDASSCNGCDIEVLAALCPGYDVERFGIINTGNPKHADVLLVTGSVNEQNKPVIQELYNQMIEPKVVVACGCCACSGGVFHDCYNVLGGVDQAIPVDVYARLRRAPRSHHRRGGAGYRRARREEQGAQREEEGSVTWLWKPHFKTSRCPIC